MSSFFFAFFKSCYVTLYTYVYIAYVRVYMCTSIFFPFLMYVYFIFLCMCKPRVRPTRSAHHKFSWTHLYTHAYFYAWNDEYQEKKPKEKERSMTSVFFYCIVLLCVQNAGLDGKSPERKKKTFPVFTRIFSCVAKNSAERKF